MTPCSCSTGCRRATWCPIIGVRSSTSHSGAYDAINRLKMLLSTYDRRTDVRILEPGHFLEHLSTRVDDLSASTRSSVKRIPLLPCRPSPGAARSLSFVSPDLRAFAIAGKIVAPWPVAPRSATLCRVCDPTDRSLIDQPVSSRCSVGRDRTRAKTLSNFRLTVGMPFQKH